MSRQGHRRRRASVSAAIHEFVFLGHSHQRYGLRVARIRERVLLARAGVWLSPEMCARASGLPVLVDHPEKGVLNSPEFAARAVGVTTYAYVK